MNCHIQIFLNGVWKTAATFQLDPQTLENGVAGNGQIEYNFEYAVANMNNPFAAIAPDLPVGFQLHRFSGWPPLLIDLLPGGAGRRAWLKRMQASKDGPHVDWHLLTKGAGAPPGNLRIAEAAPAPPPDHFKIGFPRRDIIDQKAMFLDYAEERNAFVAGASSVQGEAPKFLLVEDHNGMFHAEGALPDDQIKKFWLVKFPRGSSADPRNHKILANEAAYLEVARKFGVRTGKPLLYEDGVLFVPRFDRSVNKNGDVNRMAMHSMYAIANIPGFGATVRHDVFCNALLKVSTDPYRELIEYIQRDILNLALRNTDNHGRNTAMIRFKGALELSPLFDFAPMFLDPEGIGRVCRWENETPGSQPEWAAICEKFRKYLPSDETTVWFAKMEARVKQLPQIMQSCSVDDDIIDSLSGWIDSVAEGLRKIS